MLFSGNIRYEGEDLQQKKFTLSVDENGQLFIPSEIAKRLGLKPGGTIPAEFEDGVLHLQRSIQSLAKVYVEPTSYCNLTCRTCMRNAWNESMGSMSVETYRRILEGLHAFEVVPTVFFGGFGEPLFHPRIVEMVAEAKAVGAKVELITNGILLNDHTGRELLAAGLDRLWVSLDGSTPESYTDVRLAEAFPEILENLKNFRKINDGTSYPLIELGIAFVAMKRNIADLRTLLYLSDRIGATRYMITNLLPYTPELCSETLYNLSLSKVMGQASSLSPRIELPRMDFCDETRQPLFDVLHNFTNVNIEGIPLNQTINRCPFIARGAAVIAWDGELSPCLALMHSYTSYMNENKRSSRRYSLGNIQKDSLLEIWESKEYVNFRERVQEFNFSPCRQCGGCDLFENIDKDCYGNSFPTCGGCLWAQGVVQCP